MTPAAVSYQVRTLEKELDTKLFKRLNRKIELTKDGRLFYQHIKQPLLDIALATQQFKIQSSARSLRIHSIPFITNNLIVPNLKSLKSDMPGIPISIESRVDRATFDREHIQVALRHRRGDEDHLIYEEMTKITVSPICSVSYAAKVAEAGNSANAHKSGNCQIRLTSDEESWLTWSEQWGVHLSFDDVLYCDGFQAVLDMAIQGLGIAMGYFPILSPKFQEEGLQVLFPGTMTDFSSLYLVYHESHRDDEIISLFRGWFNNLIAQLDSINTASPSS